MVYPPVRDAALIFEGGEDNLGDHGAEFTARG